MARDVAKEKLGYYPTPPQTLSLACARLKTTSAGVIRVLDPCCGTGVALSTVAATLQAQGAKVKSYGVELSPERAEAARQQLEYVVLGEWESMMVSNQAYSLLWLNPPYDWEPGTDTRSQRLEYLFLQNALPKLQYGGLLVYLVPCAVLGRHNVARVLSSRLHEIAVYRLPAGEFETFHQVILFGYHQKAGLPDEAWQEQLLAYGQGDALPPPLEAEGPVFRVQLALPLRRLLFQKYALSATEARDLTAHHGALTTHNWQDIVRVQDATRLQPAMPLKLGHLSSIIAGGLVGDVQLPGACSLVMKGRAIKVVDYEVTTDEEGLETIVGTERFVVRVSALDEQAAYTEITRAGELEHFLAEHAPAIAQIVQQRYSPLYDGNATPEEWDHVSSLGLSRPPLPGILTPGLLSIQKHAAIAVARTVSQEIQKRRYALLIGEMGTGKTTIAAAVISQLNRFPALVLCPGHLPDKWQREIEAVIPGAIGVVIESIADLEAMVATYQPGQKLVCIMGKERAKLGGGWSHVALTKQKRGSSGRLLTLYTCPRCGEIVRDGDDVPITDFGNRRHTCAACREALYVYGSQYRRWPLATYIHRQLNHWFKVLICDEVHEYAGHRTDQGLALHRLVSSVQYMVGLTGTLFNGYATSLFHLLYRLDGCVRRDFAEGDTVRWAALFGRLQEVRKELKQEDSTLTGTARYAKRTQELPGVSPQIVKYLLPGAIFIRTSDFNYALPPFSEKIVSLDMAGTQAEQYDQMERVLYDLMVRSFREKGGKGMMAVYLQNCLARPNAAFRTERIIRREKIILAPQNVVDGKGQPTKGRKEWLEEPILDVGAVVGPGEALPKERWLRNYCLHQVAFGNKVLVFLRQTGSRDIRPRLEEMLAGAGLRVVSLPDTVVPRRREQWIAKHLSDIDILLVNPERVKTGLDLVQFNRAVFYEGACTYSLTTMWQAQRRVWRLGQTQDVEVVYLVYKGTLEEEALTLLGEKFEAAASLYGDDAASALADDASDGNILNELLKRKLAGDPSLKVDGLKGVLTKNASVQHNAPLPAPSFGGSPVDGDLETTQPAATPLSTNSPLPAVFGIKPREGVFIRPKPKQQADEEATERQLQLPLF